MGMLKKSSDDGEVGEGTSVGIGISHEATRDKVGVNGDCVARLCLSCSGNRSSSDVSGGAGEVGEGITVGIGISVGVSGDGRSIPKSLRMALQFITSRSGGSTSSPGGGPKGPTG